MRPALIAATCLLLGACAQASREEAPREEMGELEFRSPSPDFGLVGVGQVVQAEVVVANVGPGKADLGVAAADAPFGLEEPEPGTLEPGQEQRLVVKYAPASAGEHEGELRIGPFSMPLRGSALERIVDCEPLDFGAVVSGENRRLSLRCENRGSRRMLLRPGRLEGDDPQAFRIETEELEIGGKESVRVHAIFRAGMPGERSAVAALLDESGRALTSIALRGEAIDSPLSLLPDAHCESGGLFLGSALPDEELKQELFVQNRSALPIELALPQPQGKGFSFSMDSVGVEPFGGATFTLHFSASEEGIHESFVLLAREGEEPRRLCFRATVRAAPMECTPSEIDFGSRPMGKKTARSLACIVGPRDPLEGPLSLLDAVSTDPQLGVSVRGTKRSFEAGERIVLDVGWDPLDSLEAEVQLITTDRRTRVLTIPVRGRSELIDACDLPEEISFGDIRPDEGRALDWIVANHDGSDCQLGHWELGSSGGGAFALFATPPIGPLEPGRSVPLGISFVPPSEGEFEGQLTMDGIPFIRLIGRAKQRCVSATASLDLGLARTGCTTPPNEIELRNDCDEAVDIERTSMLTSHPGFFADPPPPTLEPHQSVRLSVSYTAASRREASALLSYEVESQGEHVVALSAGAQGEDLRYETLTLREGDVELLLRGAVGDRNLDGRVDAEDVVLRDVGGKLFDGFRVVDGRRLVFDEPQAQGHVQAIYLLACF